MEMDSKYLFNSSSMFCYSVREACRGVVIEEEGSAVDFHSLSTENAYQGLGGLWKCHILGILLKVFLQPKPVLVYLVVLNQLEN